MSLARVAMCGPRGSAGKGLQCNLAIVWGCALAAGPPAQAPGSPVIPFNKFLSCQISYSGVCS